MLSRARCRAAAMIGPIFGSTAGRGRSGSTSSSRATTTGDVADCAGTATVSVWPIGAGRASRVDSWTLSERAAGRVPRTGSTGSNRMGSGAGRGAGSVEAAATSACSSSSRSSAVIWWGSTRPSPSSGAPRTTTSTPECTTGVVGSGSVSSGSSSASSTVSSGASSSSAAGSIRVSTSTGVRPLASASRSATRSPVRPSYSSRVVADSGTVNVSGDTGGSAVTSSSRGCTTILPSRSQDAGDCTSTWAMSCQRSPVQVSPRRTRTPWPSASISGARLSRTTSSCTIATAASTTHHSQSTRSPVCSDRANHAIVMAAAATATTVASRARCTTATPGRPDGVKRRSASRSVGGSVSVASSRVWRASITAPLAGSRSRRRDRRA